MSSSSRMRLTSVSTAPWYCHQRVSRSASSRSSWDSLSRVARAAVSSAASRVSADSALRLTSVVTRTAKLTTASPMSDRTCSSAAPVSCSNIGSGSRAFARSVRLRARTRSTTVQISRVSRPVRSTIRCSSPSRTRGLSRRLSSACRSAASTSTISWSRRRASYSRSVVSATGMPPRASSPMRRINCRIRRARSSTAAPASSTHTGGARSRLKTRPTTAPISVSRTRAQAVSPTLVTPRTSIALIATSGTNSLTRTRWPTASEARMISARLHQVRPTRTLKAMAMTTPVTTEFTRRTLVMMVVYSVTWTTRSAVRGAVSGAASGLRCTAMT